jgi:hypothetical protein
VLALVERDGRARSFHVDAEILRGAIRQHVERDASIMTDEWPTYQGLEAEFASHETVELPTVFVRTAPRTYACLLCATSPPSGAASTAPTVGSAPPIYTATSTSSTVGTQRATKAIERAPCGAQPGRWQAPQVPRNNYVAILYEGTGQGSNLSPGENPVRLAYTEAPVQVGAGPRTDCFGSA